MEGRGLTGGELTYVPCVYSFLYYNHMDSASILNAHITAKEYSYIFNVHLLSLHKTRVTIISICTKVTY